MSSVTMRPRSSCLRVASSRSLANWANAASSRYCASARRTPPPVSRRFMILVCAAPPTRDTEMPALIAGRIPALNRSVSRKICPSVIEITLVGTNAVTSITDGQIFLETDLFNAGIRPAINAGISVSRVGGAAQTKVIKKLGGGVRLALAQYRELAAFAQFASDLDEATRKQLERGRMVTELMKQPQYQPLQVWEMALTLFAVNNAYFDDIEVKKALAADRSLRDHMKGKYAALAKTMEDKKDLSAEEEKALKAAIEDWKKSGTF